VGLMQYSILIKVGTVRLVQAEIWLSKIRLKLDFASLQIKIQGGWVGSERFYDF
jgi:hypothetical protein